MTVRDAFLQVLRIIAAMAVITFVVMHPPGGSGCYQNARGEEYCPEPDDDPGVTNQGE